MDPHLSKSLLRKIMLHYRRLLSEPIFEQRNQQVLEQVDAFVRERDFRFIHTFLPIRRNNEPDLTPLIPRWWESNRKVVISKTDLTSGELHHFYYEKDTLLEENKLGIPEPVNAIPADFSEVDLVIVPLLLFDTAGHRLGYGGGYYDRLLEGTQAVKAGISLAPPVDKLSQLEAWDVALDRVIHF